MILTPFVLAGQSAKISGIWCTDTSPSDCIKIVPTSSDGEQFTAELTRGQGGRVYAQGSGYVRGNQAVFAFRRVDIADIGFAALFIASADRAQSRSFNPDGSPRWRGNYIRKSGGAARP